MVRGSSRAHDGAGGGDAVPVPRREVAVLAGRGAGAEGGSEVKRRIFAIGLACALATAGCAGMSDTGQRTLSGGAGGAAAGAVIGALSGNAGLGAAIGGAAGASGGFLYGKHKDAERRAYESGYEEGRSGR
ncbi:MAG: hypothetical protein DCC71_12955 [Proteobacteria bacterium]|nr:MAG: hypothetical protein DCC71_12955 [Pseudomonadota bacterium]